MPTIRKRGDTYQAQVRVKRGGVIVHQESATFPRYAMAKTWGTALEAQLQREGYQSRPSQVHTLVDLLKLYERHQLKGREALSSGTEYSLSVLAAAPFANKTLRAIHSKDLVDWATSLSRLSPATILGHLMLLRSAYRMAPTVFKINTQLPVVVDALFELRKLRVTAKSRSRTRRISDAELDAITQYLQAHSAGVPTHTYVALAVALPRRREELLTALWSNYDKEQKVLTLIDTKHPTDPRTEQVPVPPKAQAILQSLPKLDERILPYKPESVSAAFQRAVRALGLLDIRLHDLRHEGISRLFEAGLDIPRVALISGHTSWSSLKRYTHMTAASVLERL
jgi:integrase